MAYKEGDKWKGNSNGRPKGSLNKDSILKDNIRAFLETKMKPEVLQDLYDRLSAKEQKNMVVELLPFVQAKKKEVDTNLNIGDGQIQFVLAPMVAPANGLEEPTGDFEIIEEPEVKIDIISKPESKSSKED